MDKEQINQLLILAEKEHLLSNIIVWLKAKGLWDECKKDVISKDLE